MVRPSRRDVLLGSVALGVCAGARAASSDTPPAEVPAPIAALTSMMGVLAPITTDEHRGRIARAQTLMAAEGLSALVLTSGTSLTYFTGAEWGDSERLFAAVLTRDGDPAWVTPAFELARAGEQRSGRDVGRGRSTRAPCADGGDHSPSAGEAWGPASTKMPFTFAKRCGAVAPAAGCSREPVTVAADDQDAHEMALMRRANEITPGAPGGVRVAARRHDPVRGVSLSWRRTAGWGCAAARGTLRGRAAVPHGTKQPGR